MIFVFGSNLAGRHGKGAALEALQKHGAISGYFYGRHGNSFAIPTKDEDLHPLPLKSIYQYVRGFLDYAARNPGETFMVTPIGTGLAGYSHEQIAPMFKGLTRNVHVCAEWQEILNIGCRD